MLFVAFGDLPSSCWTRLASDRSASKSRIVATIRSVCFGAVVAGRKSQAASYAWIESLLAAPAARVGVAQVRTLPVHQRPGTRLTRFNSTSAYLAASAASDGN